jgi:predicted nucleic acid-binding protein
MISAVTLAEVEYGLRTAPKIDTARQAIVRNVMARYVLVLPITRHTGEFFSEIRSELFMTYSPKNARGRLTKHRVEDLVERTTAKLLGVQENDIWIAAQAMETNLVLVTEDKMNHITSLQLNPGLRTIRWR